MHWELWDTDTGNIVNTYPTRDEALSVVREALRRHGRGYVRNWSLALDDGGEGATSMLEGDDLADEALKLPSA